MSKLVLAIGLTLAMAAAVAWMQPGRSSPSQKPTPASESSGSGCRKGYVSCLDCRGNIVCVPSYAFCPECPAPWS